VSWGPLVVVGAVAVVLALSATRLAVAVPDEPSRGDLAGEARLPALRWWRLATGLLALLTAIAAVIGALAPQVHVTSVVPGVATPAPPESPARWLLLTAALVLVVPALLVLVPAVAAAARPVLGVAWAGILLGGAAVLSTADAAGQAVNLSGFGADATVTPAFGYDLGAGAGWTFAALVLAVLTALAAAGTGVLEREDAGAEGPRPGGGVLTPVAAAAVLAVAAFGTPVFSAPGYVAPGLWSNFDIPSWGLLSTLVVIVGAALLALRSRPGPAAALLTGSAVLAGLHAAELPLVGGGIGGAQAATGFWLALGTAAALLIAAVMSVMPAAGGGRAE
jgi:hypothetical protein